MKAPFRLVLVILLTANLLFSVLGCGKNPNDSGNDSAQQQQDSNNQLIAESLPPGTIVDLNKQENYWIWIDGIQYKLGDPYTKFVESNFELSRFSSDKDVEEVQPQEFMNIKFKHKNRGEFSAWFYNPGPSAQPVTECILAGLDISGYYESTLAGFDHHFIGGIKINKSTTEDVRKVFGEPIDRFRNEGRWTWTYGFSVDEVSMSYTFYFDMETGVLIFCRLNSLGSL